MSKRCQFANEFLWLTALILAVLSLTTGTRAQSVTFQNPVLYPVGAAADLAVGDFDGDGKADIAVSGYVTQGNTSAVYILKGVGDGTFTPSASFIVGRTPGPIVTADFNNDGKLDLAVEDTANGIVIFLGNGDGTFTRVPGPPLLGLGSIAVADVNGDGKMDLITAGVQVFLGNGDGTFQAGKLYPAPTNINTGLVVADFNGDHHPDIAAVSSATPGAVSILLNKGDGTFAPAVSYPIASSNARGIVATDFRGGGKVDLAITDHAGNQMCVLAGRGDGTFQSGGCYGEGQSGDGIVVDDFNLDGILDAAVANDAIGAVAVLQGAGNDSFTPGIQVDLFHTSPKVATADFNGDSKPDLALVENIFGTVAILLNSTPFPANRVVRLLTTLPGMTPAGVQFQVRVDALNGNNLDVPSYSGTVHFTSSDPQAVLPPDSKLTSGFGFFVAKLRTLGQQTITATDTVNSKLASTTSTTVLAGPAAVLAIAAPSSTAKGAGFTFTVTARDAYGNIASGYTGTLHFTSSDASAMLPVNSALTQGVGTFAATLLTLGPQTITATDIVAASLTGTSSPIAVNNNVVSLSSSLNPAYFRHATVTLAVTVTAAGVAGTPTGQVTFYDGSTPLGAPVSLDPLGHASFLLPRLSIGSHRITASYGGDATFSANSSQPFFQQRSPAPRPVP